MSEYEEPNVSARVQRLMEMLENGKVNEELQSESAKDFPLKTKIQRLTPKRTKVSLQKLPESATLSEQRDAMKAEAKAWAKVFEKRLGRARTEKLTRVYQKLGLGSLRVRSDLSKNRLNVYQATGEVGELLALATLSELEIFADTEAQTLRYRKRVDMSGRRRTRSALDDAARRHMIASLRADYVRGNYFDSRSDQIDSEQETFRKGNNDEIQKIWDRARQSWKRWDHSQTFGCDEPDGTIDDTVELDGEEIWGFEARVYRAEHPVLGNDLTAILEAFGIPLSRLGINHVSVVGGIWTRIRQNGRVGDEEFVRWSEEGEWVVANGSASWMNSDDELILRETRMFASYIEARAWLKSVLPTNTGNRNGERSSSYSVGVYGINWVCHSNCNAFAMRRNWTTGNNDLVDYPLINLMYFRWGNFPLTNQQGHLGVSKKNCWWWGDDKPGGVPGAWLHYHLAPPYSAAFPPYAFAIQAGMAATDGGKGFGLSTFWDGNSFEISGTQFRTASIPFPPPELATFDEVV